MFACGTHPISLQWITCIISSNRRINQCFASSADQLVVEPFVQESLQLLLVCPMCAEICPELLCTPPIILNGHISLNKITAN